MPPKIDQGLIIILDNGRNVANADEKDKKSFYEMARECAARIIETKILSQAKNSYVGVILLGSKNTKNSVAEQAPGEFKHIELLSALQTPTWQMIRELPESPSKSKGDWMDALIVAADHFKNGVYGVKIIKTKIILLTNFCTLTKYDHDEIQQVLNGFKADNLEVNVIGPNLYDEGNIKNNDFELARLFVEQTKGVAEPFGSAMSFLLFHQRKSVNSVAWNSDLSIGPDLKIPISSYIKIDDKPVVGKWTKKVKDPVTSKPSKEEAIKKERIFYNAENHSKVESDSRTKGYQYGQQIIPFTQNEETELYASGEKGLTVYGFTHKENIQWQCLTDVGLSYVFGRKGDVKAQQAVKCLVECLLELNLVGVARRVCISNYAPKMYTLIPNVDNENGICLSMIQLCYKENIKHMVFPLTNLKKYSCTDAQVNAFKELIEAMDLTKAYDDTYDDTEAFPIGETVSPTAQYILDCIAFRSLNPAAPLPPPKDEIMTLFKVPPLVEMRSRGALEKIEKLFPLNKIEPRPKKNKQQQESPQTLTVLPVTKKAENEPFEIPKISLFMDKNSTETTSIGTMNPIDDYKALTNKGKSLSDLATEMTESIQSLLYYNLHDDSKKAVNAMKFFRNECIKSDPSIYNNWLQKLKMSLNHEKNTKVLEVINEHELNVILKSESSLSTYENEDSQLYENDTIPNTLPVVIDPEVDALFDEM